ncbi:MAG: PEGA domain-containing protein, partial [bacterium]
MSKNTNLNLDDIPLTDVDYEGVIYEPSGNSADFDVGSDISINNNSSKTNKSSSNTADSLKPKKKVAQNFNFGFFIALMFAISLGLLSVTASVLKPYVSSYFPSSKSSTKMTNVDTSPNNNIPSLTEVSQVVTQNEFTGVIKELEYISGRFVIFDFKTNITYSLVSNATTIFKDRFNSPLTLQEMKVGDIVDFSFNENSNLLGYVNLNASAFSIQNVKPEKINISDRSIKITGNTYSVSGTADIYKGEEIIEFLDLALVDKISVNGYDNIIYSIRVNNSTGTLVFVNKPSLDNAIVEIDRDYFRPLDSVDQIELEEGQHKLVIKATNVDSYLKDFEIIAGEETVLDLSDVQNKFGSILIKVDVSGYDLYINSEETEDRGYHSLRYGAYFIKVEKEGYETYETRVSINKPTDTLEIELEKIEEPEEPEEPEEFGLLSITSTPDGAEVYVDNISIGKTPLVKYNLPQGTHTIKLTLSGYNDFLLTSVSISDEPAEFNVTMHPKSDSNTTQVITSGAITTENQNQNMVDYIQETTMQNTTIQSQSQYQDV